MNTDGIKTLIEFDKSNAYKLLSETVEGLIEAIDLPSLNVTMWVNEEYRYMGFDQNPTATSLFMNEYDVKDYISGNVVFTSMLTDSEGNTVGLDDNQVQTLTNYTKQSYLIKLGE